MGPLGLCEEPLGVRHRVTWFLGAQGGRARRTQLWPRPATSQAALGVRGRSWGAVEGPVWEQQVPPGFCVDSEAAAGPRPLDPPSQLLPSSSLSSTLLTASRPRVPGGLPSLLASFCSHLLSPVPDTWPSVSSRTFHPRPPAPCLVFEVLTRGLASGPTRLLVVKGVRWCQPQRLLGGHVRWLGTCQAQSPGLGRCELQPGLCSC